MMNWYWAGAGLGCPRWCWAGPALRRAVWLVAPATRTEHPVQPVDAGRSIIDERFASGEISAEEYAAMRRSLTQAPGRISPCHSRPTLPLAQSR